MEREREKKKIHQRKQWKNYRITNVRIETFANQLNMYLCRIVIIIIFFSYFVAGRRIYNNLNLSFSIYIFHHDKRVHKKKIHNCTKQIACKWYTRK